MASMKLLDRIGDADSAWTASKDGCASATAGAARAGGSLRSGGDTHVRTGLVGGDHHAIDTRPGGTEPTNADGVTSRAASAAAACPTGAARTSRSTNGGKAASAVLSPLATLAATTRTANAACTASHSHIRYRERTLVCENGKTRPPRASAESRTSSATACSPAATRRRRNAPAASSAALSGTARAATSCLCSNDPARNGDIPGRERTGANRRGRGTRATARAGHTGVPSITSVQQRGDDRRT